MKMWGFIFGGAIIAAILSIFFLWTRFCKFGIVQKLSGGRKWLWRLLGLFPMLVIGIFMVFSLVNTGIVVIHMSFYWLIAEGIGALVRRLRRRKKDSSDAEGTDDRETSAEEKKQGREKGFHPYWIGIIVLCIELCYFSIGWYQAHHVWETDYQLVTEKDLGMERLRIAQIADSHIGTTFDGEGFAKHLETIQATEPDLLVITGDFVDDDSTKEDMYRSCLALAGFRCKYGVYFVYGNHDKGYMRYRNFTADELREALEAAGVHVMRDGVELVDGKFYVIGRQDKSVGDRAPIGQIVSMLDQSKYMIILDHQPNDYDAEAATGADLVLSGHSHGGQMLVMKLVGGLIGTNDQTYGIETRDKTTFIVTSGISDWSIKFKTGCRSEFVIIDVTQQ